MKNNGSLIVNRNMAFKYHSEGGKALTKSQKDLLESIENLPFPFDGLSALHELRRRTSLSVVISDRMSLKRVLEDAIQSIKTKIEEYKVSGIMWNGNVEAEIYNRLRWAEKQLEIADNPRIGDIPLLGLYTRKLLWFDKSAPVVYLFADNIRNYAACNIEMDENNVFAFVYVHEMMHAYYDAFNSVGFPAKELIEEAFAEFGMLSFLYKSYGSQHSLFDQARLNVFSKIENGPREYGFGLELFELSGRDGKEMIERYKDISNWIDSSVIHNEFSNKCLGNYFSDITHYINNKDDTNVEKYYKDIQDILNYSWQPPDLKVQSSIAPSPTSSVSIRGHASLLFSSPQQTAGLVCLMREKKIEQIVSAIIRVLKHEGFESNLYFRGRHVSYSGNDLFYFTAIGANERRPVRSLYVPESICISGTTVYPMFIREGISQYGSILNLMSSLVGAPFSLVSESNGYSLYGPMLNNEYESLLFAEKLNYGECKYDVVVKKTSAVLGKGVPQYKVPFIVVKHFCENNKGITWKDLQIAFDRVKCPMPQFLEWITPRPIVDAYCACFPSRMTLFDRNPIRLASGESVLVLRYWRFLRDDAFGSFLENASVLGYEIHASNF